MNFLINLFNLILYQPLLNLLILFYQYLPGNDFGMAVIFLTILIRILLYPLIRQAIKSQRLFEDLQSRIEEVKRKYKEDREKQTQEIINLYKEAKINPLSSLIPILIQLPILIALYRVFLKGIQPQGMVGLYQFLPKPKEIFPYFFGKINLAQPNLFLTISAGISQFIQTKMVTKEREKIDQFSKLLQKQTLYFFPVLTILILLKLPSAIALYWLVSTIFLIIQQHFVLRRQTSS